MKRHAHIFLRIMLLPLFMGSLLQNQYGIWMSPVEVPLERLLRNVEAHIKKNPNEAQGYYVLGRLHSLAFAKETNTIAAYENAQRPLPGLPPNESILVPRNSTKPPSAEALQHLRESIRNYQRATELAPNEAPAFLGLGWMLETSARLAPQRNANDLPPTASEGQNRALAAYRKAYALTIQQDLAKEFAGPGADSQISLEAGQGILRLLQARPEKLSVQEQQELTEIGRALAKLRSKPHAVTPIIFSLEQAVPLEELLAPGSCVRFDLSGDGEPRLWPWVKPETGLLVWDQTNRRRVQSGIQLFGSSTWWIAWQNGYQPLALLDDDRDGWLAGTELNGLAVWRDRNTNGNAEKTEVLPVRRLGIRRIAVRATTQLSGVPANPQGLQMNDGRRLPTYDWTPVEIQAPALARASGHSRAYAQKEQAP